MKVFQLKKTSNNIIKQSHPLIKPKTYINQVISNCVNFKGGVNFAIHTNIKARISDLVTLNTQNPSGINLHKKLSKIIPLDTTNSFIALTNRLTPYNNEELDNIVVDKFEELFNFAKKNKSSASIENIVEYTLKSFNLNMTQKQVHFLPKIMDFIKSNLDLKNLNKILELCQNKEKTAISEEKIDLFNHLAAEKVPFYSMELALKSDYSQDKEFLNNYIKLANLTLTKEEAIILTKLIYEKDMTADYIVEFFEKALKRRKILESFGKKVDEKDLKKLLFSNSRKTLNTLEFLGEKTFLYSFIDKYKKVKENIQAYGDIRHQMYYENILEIINPQASKKYKEVIRNIKELKRGFNDKTSEEKTLTIKKINENNLVVKTLLDNSVKDPQIALRVASIYKTLWVVNPSYVEKILPYLNFKDEESQKKMYKILNEIILQNLGITTKIAPERLDLTKSCYFPTLFETEGRFNLGLRSILNLLSAYPNLSTTEVFNLLPQNKETREIFEENGINYDNWVNYTPTSYIEYNLETDIENAKKNAIQNLESDFNDLNFAYLPNYVINDLKESLEKGGYLLEDESLDFNEYTKKLYKRNKKPIEYKDLKPIISIILDEIIKKDFWKTEHPDKSTEKAKQLMKNKFIGERSNEIRILGHNKNDKNQIIPLKFQKTDMNNIEKALFIGNDAGCCSGIGKTRDWTAPPYVINKFISCIEIRDDRQGIGNTMCYIAKVDDIPSLILDNIEIKPEYQYIETIKNGIIDYAKRLCLEIGKPDMPIYIGPNRNKIHLDEYDRVLKNDVQILGSSGDTEVYLDFFVMPLKVRSSKKFKITLYKIR